MKLLLIFSTVVAVVMMLLPGYNIERVPIELAVFGLVTTGVVWGLGKI